MTTEQLKQALDVCSEHEACGRCPAREYCGDLGIVTGEALNVIEQLEAEKDALMGELDMRQDAQATGKAVIKEIDEWLAKTGEEEARQAGAMPNDYGCKHLDDPNWKKWWCGDCGDYCKRCGFLEQLGYKNYHRIMNAKDYGIPQNRNRCFMVSILGDYYYTFPTTRKLKYLLKDFLDRHVDEKYYLSDATIEMFEKHTAEQQAKGNGFKFEPATGGGYAKTISTRAGGRTDDNFIIEQRNEARTDDDGRGNDLCEGPQRLRKPSNERGRGNAGGGAASE